MKFPFQVLFLVCYKCSKTLELFSVCEPRSQFVKGAIQI